MGNREDLLAGAKRCVMRKGFSQVTARDLAEAAGVSLAAIGYHFGSKDVLLTQAMIALMDEWGEQFQAIPAVPDEGDPVTRFGVMWDRLFSVFTANRPLAAASFEVFPAAEQTPELRERLAAAQAAARRGLICQLHGVDEDTVSDETAATVGSLYLALLSGVLAQWLIAPAAAPGGADLAAAIHAIATGTQTGPTDGPATTD